MSLLLNWRLWVLLAVLGVLAESHLTAYRHGKAKVRAEWDKEKAALIAQHDAEQAKARKREQEMQDATNKIAREAEQRNRDLAARVATANAAAASLRDEITALNSRPAPKDPAAAAYANEARVARELLGTCAAGYRGLAEEADGLRDQVTGLQAYARSVR